MSDDIEKKIRLAQRLYADGLFREAMLAASDAREAMSRNSGETDGSYAALLSSLGVLHQQMGDYSAAALLLQDAVKRFRAIPRRNDRHYALSLANLAAFYEATGHYSAAEPLNQEALQIQSQLLGENHPDCAITLNNLAVVYKLTGKVELAERLLFQALDVKRATLGGNHPSCAGVLNNIGELYRSRGRYERADEYYRMAADNLRMNGKDRSCEYAQVINNSALLYKCLGDFDLAEPLYLEALDVWESSLGKDHSEYAEGLFNLSALYVATGRTEEAWVLLGRGLTIEDRVLGQVLSAGSESHTMAHLVSVHNNMAAYLSLFLQNRFDSEDASREAFQLVLRRKGIAAEALAIQRDAVLSGRYPALEPKLRELTELRKRLALLVLAGPGAGDSDTHHRLVTSLHSQKERSEEDLARHIPEMNLDLRLRAVDAGAVQRLLPDGAALVEFVRFNVFNFKGVIGDQCWLPARYVAFVVTASSRDDVRAIDLGDADLIDRLVEQFRDEILRKSEQFPGRDMIKSGHKQKGAYRTDPGQSLRSAVFDKLLDGLGGIRRLFLAPDGNLARLPFEALPTAHRSRLIDEYTISYFACGRDLVRLGNVSSAKPSAPLVIVDPDFDFQEESSLPPHRPLVSRMRNLRDSGELSFHFDRLPGTRKEGERIGGLFGVKPWQDVGALEGRLRTECRSPLFLHLATHGFFLKDEQDGPLAGESSAGAADDLGGSTGRLSGRLPRNPLLRSGLALAGANTWLQEGVLPPVAEDGLLTAEDVTGLDLLNTELVVLSACETGLGDIRVGEGVFGLRRAFVLAGAKSLIMSLWKVPDEPTRDLMEVFYQRILAGCGRAAALRESQLALKARYPEPFYWGAFICQGDPNSLDATRWAKKPETHE
jgi:CHAT domain-containing protein/tetratricopeptide (TPR) repeat protein